MKNTSLWLTDSGGSWYMSTGKNKEILVKGDFCLGKYPEGFDSLLKIVYECPCFEKTNIKLDASWFDQTILCALALFFRTKSLAEPCFHINFTNNKKLLFLWRSGFFENSHVGYQNSPFEVSSSVWNKKPKENTACANFTPMIRFEVPKEKSLAKKDEILIPAQQYTNNLLKELEKTKVYSYVEKMDLMQSREYLHIVLWELIQNVIDHAHASHGMISAQIFYMGDTVEDELKGLKAQHKIEVKNCTLPLRRKWLERNASNDYLMLSCVDNGIGIPNTMKPKSSVNSTLDINLIQESFQRCNSEHDNFEHSFAIHGLHLIKQLVESYEGYLYVQSGNAEIEIDGNNMEPNEIKVGMPGSSFQLLLPMSASKPRKFAVSISKENDESINPIILNVIEEIRKHSFKVPLNEKNCKKIVESMVDIIVSEKKQGTLYLDFLGMPRERHYLSCFFGQLLLCVRRKKTNAPVVVLNSSEELFAAIKCLRSQANQDDIETELVNLDKFLSTDMTRKENNSLPLIFMVTRLSNDKRGIAVQWLGIGNDGPQGIGKCLIDILDELFYTDGGVEESFLVRKFEKDGINIKRLLKNLNSVNGNLISYEESSNEWSLAITASNLYFNSIHSQSEKLFKAINTKAKFDKSKYPDAIFCLNWRGGSEAYLSDYYELWKVVSNPELSKLAASLLLYKAYETDKIANEIPNVRGLVSITASAGQVARELARTLRIPHWEVPSIYDLPNAEWPDFENKSIFIVDDLIDTGNATRRVLKTLKKKNAKCVGILAILGSKEGLKSREELKISIVELFEVDLGRPHLSNKQIEEAEKKNNIWEVDPHTLEPSPLKTFNRKAKEKQKEKLKELNQLAANNGLRSGHFVYGGHHYYEFFDLVRYINNQAGFQELQEWFIESIRNWHDEVIEKQCNGQKTTPISLIYPYYSPIAAFLHRMQPLLASSFQFECHIHVARPSQRSKSRQGYHLDSMSKNDKYAVFIDDGIASGGTLSEIIDEFVSLHSINNKNGRKSQSEIVFERKIVQHRAAFLALTVFDRIGMHPRKHLKNILSYNDGIRFDFTPKYSLNLRSYTQENCPICQITSDVNKFYNKHNDLENRHKDISDQIEHNLKSVISMLEPTYLSSVESFESFGGMQLLSSKDTADVVNASDAIFTDSVSGYEIKKSIEDIKKTPVTRLEMILKVVMDSILCRSVHHEKFFVDNICKLLWGNDVSNEYRCYFLLHIPYFADEKLSKLLLTKSIPFSLRSSRSVEYPISVKDEKLTLVNYFNNYPKIFYSIVISIKILRAKYNQNSNWDTNWVETLRKSPYGNLFSCLMCSTKQDIAKKYALMLICNFTSSYSEHKESLSKRLTRLRNDVLQNYRKNNFPLHLMEYIGEAIEKVSRHYDLDEKLLPDSIMKNIIKNHSIWLTENTPSCRYNLTESLETYFIQQTQNEVNIKSRILEFLVPKTKDVVNLAIEQFQTWLEEQFRYNSYPNGDLFETQFADENKENILTIINKFQKNVSNKVPEYRIFGNTQSLVRTLSHLLRNPYESGIGRKQAISSKGVRKLLSSILLSVMPGKQTDKRTVRFQITSDQKMNEDKIKRCFRAGGGLMAQKQIIETWDGNMGGFPLGNKTVFFIEVEVVDLTRKENI